MWYAVVFLIIQNSLIFFNKLPTSSYEECLDMIEMSSMMFPDRLTMCVLEEEVESI